MEKTILFLQQLLECTSGVSLACIPRSEAAVSDFLKRSAKHTLDRLPQRFFRPAVTENAICEHLILERITYLIYSSPEKNAVIFLGPVLTRPYSREDMLSVFERNNVSRSIVSPVLQYCSQLPVVPGHILYRMGELIVRHLTEQNKPLNIAQEKELPSPEKLLLHQAIPADENIAKMRQVEMRYEHSAALTDAIKQGNLSLALHMIGQYSPNEQTPVRNTNPLRNAQNYCIVLNTHLRHALEETGIHPYRIDTLSNEIGLEIEQLKSISQIPAFFNQVIRRYCRLVQEHTYPNLKPLVNLAVAYIKENLADNLTVKDTAKALTVNANYLSTLFHNEMGMTFIDFVNKERTNQAAALLKHTNLQIQQIATTVGYNNTSYFSRQFVRFQGVSPSQFRRG